MISRRDALGIGAGAAVAACGQRDEGGITWWALGAVGENAPLLLPPFQRVTGIRVDSQAVPWTGAHEKLLSGFAGDSLPDVMMLNSDWLPELALVGALAALPTGTALLADRFAGARALVDVDGRAVAVPWTADSWVQFYRRDLIAEVGYPAPPLDWPEWRRMAHSIKRRHPGRYVTLHLLDWPEPLFNFAAQQSVPMLRDVQTRGNFSSPGFRAALAFYRSIFDDGFAPIVTGAEVGDTYLSLRRGWFAIMPSNAVTIGDLRLRANFLPPDNWSVARTPGPSGPGAAMARGTCLAVSHIARDPARAWQLVEYLCRATTQCGLYRITGDLPTRPSAWTVPGLRDDGVSQTFARQIAHSVPAPAVPEWERIVTEVQLVAEHMVRGDYSVEAATIEMDKRVDRILEKRRWLLDRGKAA
ncbi:extracellular solute-binding protein [Sphingomonas bacterium]|uniref:extracellular solute-binding protein n=1 Tax=Sphingomonas bacterium TaxID=1895847 RepID=UPI0020C5CD62|nr:extracellular solute-binding protein [Sphingomonas bacterium]